MRYQVNSDKVAQVAPLVKELYSIVKQLETLFPGRHFTPDGHLVGSIGEVLAAHQYNLELFQASNETHDAKSPDGRLVQIKATQGKSIGLSSEPEFLIVLKILANGSTEEIYNGPGFLAWNKAGKKQKNGQRNISVSALRRLMDEVEADSRMPGSKK